MRALLVLLAPLLLGCGPNAPCLRSHQQTSTVLVCTVWIKAMCGAYVPITSTDTVCDAHGTPYPAGDPRR
jgi:hypothetical protein